MLYFFFGKSTAKYTAFTLLFDMPYPTKLIYKCAMSYKLTFFCGDKFAQNSRIFPIINQENLATKSIYQKYKKKI